MTLRTPFIFLLGLIVGLSLRTGVAQDRRLPGNNGVAGVFPNGRARGSGVGLKVLFRGSGVGLKVLFRGSGVELYRGSGVG